MKPMMGISEDTIPLAEATIRSAFADVSAILELHPYLADGAGGQAFGGADLAFSALVGWVLMPLPQYHNGACHLPNPDVFRSQPGYCVLNDELRATRAGRHVQHCYATYRVATDLPSASGEAGGRVGGKLKPT